MTVEKRLSIRLSDIVAIQFRCVDCGSVLSQTGNEVVYKCGGCRKEWNRQDQQGYMLAIGNFLAALNRLKKKETQDPNLEIALEFKDVG